MNKELLNKDFLVGVVVVIAVLILLKLIYNGFEKSEHMTTIAKYNPQLFDTQMTSESNEVYTGLPNEVDMPFADNNQPDNEHESVATVGDSMPTLNQTYCSPSCCSPQYPVPFEANKDKYMKSVDGFVGTNITCNNGLQNAGCLCMTPTQANFHLSRGGNSSTCH